MSRHLPVLADVAAGPGGNDAPAALRLGGSPTDLATAHLASTAVALAWVGRSAHLRRSLREEMAAGHRR